MNPDIDIKELFPMHTLGEWKSAAEKDLKTKSLNDLISQTYEGIYIEPLYTRTDLDKIPFAKNLPSFYNYLRGFKPDGNVVSPWLIAQKLTADDIDSLKRKYVKDESHGLNSVSVSLSFNGTNITVNNCIAENINAVIEFLNSKEFTGVKKLVYSSLPVEINLLIYQNLTDKNSSAFACDFFSSLFDAGIFDKNEFIKNVKQISISDHSLKFLLNTVPVINAGGNAVQELSILLSLASEIMNHSVPELLSRFYAIIGLDSDFFINIAKIRALRILWANFCDDISQSIDYSLFIHASSSLINKSRLDKHTNILRTATEAFAAALADADAITTLPYDFFENESSELSERIARNMQLILNHESHIGKVIDPLSGAYFIESLTKQLTERAWEMFIEIEKRGGFVKTYQDGFITKIISDSRSKKLDDIESGKFKIVGVNYSNGGKEKLRGIGQKKSFTQYVKIKEGITIENFISDDTMSFTEKLKPDAKCEPLNQSRLTEKYEKDLQTE